MSSSHEHNQVESPNEAKAVVSLLLLALAGVACCLGIAVSPMYENIYVLFAGACFGFGYILGFESPWIDQIKQLKLRASIAITVPILLATLTCMQGWWFNLPESEWPSIPVLYAVGMSGAIVGFAMTQLIRRFFRKNN